MGQGTLRFDITDQGRDTLRSLTIGATVASLLDDEERRAESNKGDE